MRLPFVVSLLSFLGIALIAGAGIQISGIAAQSANQTLNDSIAFVNLVNESGYLIFSPNLTQAYSDLATAEKLYPASPSSAVVFANKAVEEANSEYVRINRYRNTSLVVMSALSLVFVLALAFLYKPVKQSIRNRRKA